MLIQFTNLMEGYRNLSTIQVDEKVYRYKKLLIGFKPFIDGIKEEKKNNALSYNIFSVLKIGHYEAKVHTPFLANFLDINGSHSQGDLFYKSFVQKFVPNSKMERFSNINTDLFSCMQERRFNKSQPDIYIRHDHPNENKKFAFIIENKINAGDQERQVERYYKEVLKEEHNYRDEQILIFYLTPNPIEPTEYSLNIGLKEELIKSEVFFCINYVNDITSWLIETKENIKANRLSNIIEHYLETIKTF